MLQEEATSTSTSQLTAMLQPYIEMAKEKVKEPLVEDPNMDKAIKGKGREGCCKQGGDIVQCRPNILSSDAWSNRLLHQSSCGPNWGPIVYPIYPKTIV